MSKRKRRGRDQAPLTSPPSPPQPQTQLEQQAVPPASRTVATRSITSTARFEGPIPPPATDDGLVVKRAGRDASGAWQLVSDNPNTHVWPLRPWPPDAVVVGEVKWAARTFA